MFGQSTTEVDGRNTFLKKPKYQAVFGSLAEDSPHSFTHGGSCRLALMKSYPSI